MTGLLQDASDWELVARLGARREDAQGCVRELHGRHGEQVFSLARRMLGDSAYAEGL